MEHPGCAVRRGHLYTQYSLLHRHWYQNIWKTTDWYIKYFTLIKAFFEGQASCNQCFCFLQQESNPGRTKLLSATELKKSSGFSMSHWHPLDLFKLNGFAWRSRGRRRRGGEKISEQIWTLVTPFLQQRKTITENQHKTKKQERKLKKTSCFSWKFSYRIRNYIKAKLLWQALLLTVYAAPAAKLSKSWWGFKVVSIPLSQRLKLSKDIWMD